MNRRAFIRSLAGGAAAVCGIPLLRSKPAKQIGIDIGAGPDRTAVMICERYYGDGGPYRVLKMWSPITPLGTKDYERIMRAIQERRAQILDEVGRDTEELLWGKPTSPEYGIPHFCEPSPQNTP